MTLSKNNEPSVGIKLATLIFCHVVFFLYISGAEKLICIYQLVFLEIILSHLLFWLQEFYVILYFNSLQKSYPVYLQCVGCFAKHHLVLCIVPVQVEQFLVLSSFYDKQSSRRYNLSDYVCSIINCHLTLSQTCYFEVVKSAKFIMTLAGFTLALSSNFSRKN